MTLSMFYIRMIYGDIYFNLDEAQKYSQYNEYNYLICGEETVFL